MCPCMCPWLRWLRSQILPGCAPACASGSAGSGAKFLQDAPLHVPLHVPLAPRAPEPNSSRMRPFMCPWLRELRSQIPPGCDPSCAPACAHGAGANCSTIRTFDDVEAAAAPGKEAHRRWASRFLQDAPLDVTLHVPLASLAPEPNSSRMCPFMCPRVRPRSWG